MDLRRTDLDGLNRLGQIWKDTPGSELEALLTGLDLTGWQDVIQYLRSLGMRENPQIVKLNICLSNDLRFTLEGAGVIQAYCADNRLTGKPFIAMLKEGIEGAEPVNLDTYGARAKLKRETPLDPADARVKEALERWDQLGKHFRHIQRFEFTAPSGLAIRFDISLVRENAQARARTFQEGRVTLQSSRYEAEVELTASRESTSGDQAAQLILRGLSWLLQGRQRSFVLVSQRGADAVRDTMGRIFGSGSSGAGGGAGARGNSNKGRNGRGGFRYPGPQPATLVRAHITPEPEPGVPNLRTMPGGYNVTDKADGLRCALYVAENGKIFLVDGGGRIYATGKQTEPALAGLVLDGEWITRSRTGAPISHFYTFDILAARGGDTSIAGQPFAIVGALPGSQAAAATRQSVMAAAVSALGSAAQTVRGVPPSQNLQIGMKSFRVVGPGSEEIFRDAAAATLEDAKGAPYKTDGLIFTPNAAPLPLVGRGGAATWHEQLKWKPPMENTIDFLVIVDHERDAGGQVLGNEAIGTKFREDTGGTVRYKTLRLFVGSRKDAAFADPRTAVLSEAPLPSSVEEGEYRQVEFRPTAPRDPMASICYVPIGEGQLDPAGAAPAAVAMDTDTDVIRTRTGDIIQSDMIVEMAYDPSLAPGFRWIPMRIRHDKTERWGRGIVTMNADWVANDIWTSLHNPVTEEMIRTGQIVECVAPAAREAPATYYSRRAPQRDLMKSQCLRNFHNDVIKRDILLKKTMTPGSTLCDLAMGKAGDLHKWIAQSPSYVFGCDVAAGNLNDPEDGAYRRLLDKMIALGGRDRVPPMVFVQADAARRLTNGDAGITPEDQAMLVREFGAGGRASNGFDTVSCMFATHYMFRDENTLAGFLTNLADTVKVGGYFVGCGFDGDAVARLLVKDQTVAGRDGNTDVWAITKRYGTEIGSSVPPSALGLGRAIDVDFISIGETHTEYLVSWPYLESRMAEVGLELLTTEELAALGLPASTQMFGDTWRLAEKNGKTYAMSPAIQQFSFLNRWYIFKRRADRRPAPPTGAVAPPEELTEQIPLPATEAAAVAGPAPPIVGAGEAAVQPGPAPPGEAAAGAGEAEAPALIVLEEPPKPFVVNPDTREPDLRLGEELKDWPRYMSTVTLVELSDRTTPSIKYPSLEAAIGSARYQLASDKAELGAQVFRVEGTIHTKFEKERAKLVETGAPQEAIDKTVNDETTQIRNYSGAAKMKSAFGATFNKAAWDAQKLDVYKFYLEQRYATDARFRAMIDAIKAKGGEILFANGKEPTELGVGVRVDGSIAGGENKVGLIMMGLGS